MTEARVRAHTRADGTRVKAHSRNLSAWKKAGGAWVCTGASLATSVALVAELGFTIVGAVAMILTAVIGALAVGLTTRAAKPKRRKVRRSRLITVSVPARQPAKRKTSRKTSKRR